MTEATAQPAHSMTPAELPTEVQAPAPPVASSMDAESIENRYYAFLRQSGYSTTTALLDVLRVYLPLFEGHTHVADLGAGHGEFLQLLAEQGHTVSGVDIDPAMAAHCQALGLDVAHGDALAWLDVRPESLDGLFSSNVVEHLSAEMVARWVAASWRALRPGGVLVLTTPNPESLIVQFHEFWRDPTHVRMYSRQLLEFMLADAGFERVTSHANPASAWEGIGEMLQGVRDDLASAVLPEAPPPLRTPEPAPPPQGAAWREQQAWRLSHLVFKKFLEPWLLPLRRDLENDRTRSETVLANQREAIEGAHRRIDLLLERIRRLDAVDRFAYPPRETYVVGFKPAPQAIAPTETP